MIDLGVRARLAVNPRAASSFVGTLATIVLLIVALLFFDLFLAGIDRRESDQRAAAEYAIGSAALRAGRASDAADHFGVALGLRRANVNYALALAEAMLQDGRTADAESTLRAPLENAENDGAVNLTMAHVMIREGRSGDAKSYLHRAIFGRWGGDSVERRNEARFELIDLLVQRGPPAELLAELLPLEATSPDSAALQRRLGDLFMVAGSPARAANMFRAVLRRDSTDGEAYAGMGNAALALGNLRTARGDFVEAARLRPDDERIANRLALVDTMLTLDPTPRGLNPGDQLSRSRAVLSRTVSVVGSCVPTSSPALDSARTLLASKASPGVGKRYKPPDAETLMEAVADLWASRPAACSAATQDEVLRSLIARINQ